MSRRKTAQTEISLIALKESKLFDALFEDITSASAHYQEVAAQLKEKGKRDEEKVKIFADFFLRFVENTVPKIPRFYQYYEITKNLSLLRTNYLHICQ